MHGTNQSARSRLRGSHRSRTGDVLIIADEAQHCRLLSDAVERIGGRSIAVTHPLEAITRLEQNPHEIGFVLVPTQPGRFETHEFLAFMRTEYPLMRRIGYSAQAGQAREDLVESRVTCPTTRRRLRAALECASDRGPTRTRADRQRARTSKYFD